MYFITIHLEHTDGQLSYNKRRGRRKRWAPAGSKSASQQAKQQQRRPRRPVVNAMLRGQVSLKCNLQSPDQDDEVSLILWYKDNSMVPIYR